MHCNYKPPVKQPSPVSAACPPLLFTQHCHDQLACWSVLLNTHTFVGERMQLLSLFTMWVLWTIICLTAGRGSCRFGRTANVNLLPMLSCSAMYVFWLQKQIVQLKPCLISLCIFLRHDWHCHLSTIPNGVRKHKKHADINFDVCEEIAIWFMCTVPATFLLDTLNKLCSIAR